MILTCPECATKFHLADDRIPSGGAKVRCSRCKHIFWVEKPGANILDASPTEHPREETELSGTHEQWISFRRPPRRRRSFLMIAIVALLLAAAFAAYDRIEDLNKVWRYLSSLKQHLFLWEEKEGKIALEKLRGFYVENQFMGRIFVVEGLAVNHWQESRSFIRVKGTLLNPQGQKVQESYAYCGNILSEKDLKEMTKEAIHKSLSSQFGISFSNMNIPPGKAVPFMIAFTDLPAEAGASKGSEKTGPTELSDFTVEVVGSQKGSK